MKTRQTNFGGNQAWASRCYQPANEAEVLEILARHRRGAVRAVGSKHSWSAVAVSGDASIDMSGFSDVQLREEGGAPIVRVGAGCRLQDLLDRLHATSARTLPTLGVIKRQTISGAISTGTHGSGMQSLSHFVVGVRVAAYDPEGGEPKVFDYRAGDELRASRCGIGCTGIILSVDLATVPKYRIEERVSTEATLEAVLRAYRDYPLTQFALVPHAWEYLVFERRPVSTPRSLLAPLLRLYNTVWVDVVFHLFVKASIAAGAWAVKSFLGLTPALSLRYRRVDDAEHVLTMGHHYFRHEEMELFVTESRLAEALDLLRYATEVFAGEHTPPPRELQASLEAHGLYGELQAARGSHVHHYPFSIRRLLPEDALISMGSAAAEPLFSISVFTYEKPGARAPYYRYCRWLARCMHALFGARLHWGKHCPLSTASLALLYPRFDAFKRVCSTYDPHGVFRNEFTAPAFAQGHNANVLAPTG